MKNRIEALILKVEHMKRGAFIALMALTIFLGTMLLMLVISATVARGQSESTPRWEPKYSPFAKGRYATNWNFRSWTEATNSAELKAMIDITNTVTLEVSGGGGGGDTNFTILATVALMKAQVITNAGHTFLITDTNGTGGTFVATTSNPSSYDEGVTVQPDTGNGAFIRQYTGRTFHAKWWGATVTNSTLQKAINYANGVGGGAVIMPSGITYLDPMTNVVVLKSGVGIEGEQGAQVSMNLTPDVSYVYFDASNTTNAYIANLTMTGYPGAPGATTNTGYAVNATSAQNFTIQNVTATGFYTSPFLTVNAVNPSVASILQKAVDVRDFGADPTAVTDSRNAFQAALNYARSNSVQVFIAPGHYKIVTTRPLYWGEVSCYGPGWIHNSLPDGYTYSAGYYSTGTDSITYTNILTEYGTMTNWVTTTGLAGAQYPWNGKSQMFSAPTNCSIQINVDGGWGSEVVGTVKPIYGIADGNESAYYQVFSCFASANITFQNCNFRNIPGAAIEGGNWGNVKLLASTIVNVGDHGFYSGGGSSNIIVNGNTFVNTRTNSGTVNTTNWLHMASTATVKLRGVVGFTVNGNVFNTPNPGDCIHIESQSYQPGHLENFTIAGNSFKGYRFLTLFSQRKDNSDVPVSDSSNTNGYFIRNGIIADNTCQVTELFMFGDYSVNSVGGCTLRNVLVSGNVVDGGTNAVGAVVIVSGNPQFTLPFDDLIFRGNRMKGNWLYGAFDIEGRGGRIEFVDNVLTQVANGTGCSMIYSGDNFRHGMSNLRLRRNVLNDMYSSIVINGGAVTAWVTNTPYTYATEVYDDVTRYRNSLVSYSGQFYTNKASVTSAVIPSTDTTNWGVYIPPSMSLVIEDVERNNSATIGGTESSYSANILGARLPVALTIDQHGNRHLNSTGGTVGYSIGTATDTTISQSSSTDGRFKNVIVGPNTVSNQGAGLYVSGPTFIGTTNAAGTLLISSAAGSVSDFNFVDGSPASYTNKFIFRKTTTGNLQLISLNDAGDTGTILMTFDRSNNRVSVGVTAGDSKFNVFGGDLALYGDTTNGIVFQTTGTKIRTGSGSPESVVGASPGSLWLDTGGALYYKASGSGTTGWTLVVSASGLVSDTAYDATSWNGVTTIAPSKNAVRDEVETLITSIAATVSNTAYDATSWNGVTTIAPSKDAVRDQVETMLTSISGKQASGTYVSSVEDEGSAVTARTTMNFVGSGVSVADTGGKTTVTISGGGSLSGSGTSGQLASWNGSSSLTGQTNLTFSSSGGTTQMNMIDTAGSSSAVGLTLSGGSSRTMLLSSFGSGVSNSYGNETRGSPDNHVVATSGNVTLHAMSNSVAAAKFTLDTNGYPTVTYLAEGTVKEILGDASFPRRFSVFEEFFGHKNSANHLYGQNSWLSVLGTGCAVADGTPDANRPGIMQLSTSSTTSAAATLHLGVVQMYFGGGEVTFATAVNLGALSSVAAEYIFRIGTGDDNTTGDHVDGVYFEYDRLNIGTNWTGVAASNSSRTRTAQAGATTVATGWVTLKYVVNAAATSATFYVNGASIGTVASNFPTTSSRLSGPHIKLLNTAGTGTKTVDIDYVWMQQIFTTER